MNFKKIVSITISVFFCGILSAQPKGFTKVKDVKTVKEKLNSASEKIETIQSDFVQYKHLDMLENDVESTGKFYYLRPSSLRWEYVKPYKYLIKISHNKMLIDDGKKVKTYDTESNKVFKEVNNIMMGMLKGDILQSDRFNVQLFENKSEISAILKPKNESMTEYLSSIELFFSKSDYNVSKIKMNELEGDFTKIIFKNIVYNKQIPAEIIKIH